VKAYSIADASILDFSSLSETLSHISTKAEMIVYRDKGNPHYRESARIFVQTASRYHFEKILVHSDIPSLSIPGVDGIHLTSAQIDEIGIARKHTDFVIVSTHSIEEAKRAEEMGADMVTFSPIFQSPGKGKPQGLETLSHIVERVDIPVIALGGIVSHREIELCEKAGADLFASIRYFVE
jgi:thiamine-phosphate pyrophosphorylase